MKVACPQCGADIDALTETSFYRCPWCASSFVVAQGERLLQYTFLHERDDRFAWSCLQERLADSGISSFERRSCSYTLLPCWLFTMADGTRRVVAAAGTGREELSRLSLPGGDLVFLPKGASYPPPEIPAATAAAGLGTGVKGKSLLYLPLYLLDYDCDGSTWQAAVSGIDGRVYAVQTPAAVEDGIPHRHYAMVAALFALLLGEGFFLRSLALRSAIIAGTVGIAYPLFTSILRKER